MMQKTLQIDVVDSENEIFSGEVEYFVAPASAGEIGVYPNHIPIISKLKPGVLRMQLPGHTHQLIFAISGGFLEIQNNHATILADIIERTDELDEERLQQQKNDALAKIQKAGSSGSSDVAHAQASLEIAIAQLKALKYINKRMH